MPISAEKMKFYPGGSTRSKEWQAIREQVRKRSGDKCEACGLANGALILRSKDGAVYFVDDDLGSCVGWVRDANTGEKIEHVWLMETPRIEWQDFAVSIVLTVAHLHENDEATTDIDRLRHLCQKCHNSYDGKMRAGNARKTRDARNGQGALFEEPAKA